MLVNLTDFDIDGAEDFDALEVLFRLAGDAGRIDELADMVNAHGITELILDADDEYLDELRDLLPDVDIINLPDYLEKCGEID